MIRPLSSLTLMATLAACSIDTQPHAPSQPALTRGTATTMRAADAFTPWERSGLGLAPDDPVTATAFPANPEAPRDPR